MEAKIAHAHAEAAELDADIGATRKPLDRRRPTLKLLLLACIGADPKRTPDVIEDDAAVRERTRKVGEFIDLRMVEPGVEAEAEAVKDGKAPPKRCVCKQAARRAVRGIADGWIRIPCGDVSNAAEAIAADAHVRLEYRCDRVAQRQIGVPDDPRAMARRTVDAARTHGGDAVDKLGFADGAHGDGTRCAYHGARLHEHGGNDVMAAAGVGEQL